MGNAEPVSTHDDTFCIVLDIVMVFVGGRFRVRCRAGGIELTLNASA